MPGPPPRISQAAGGGRVRALYWSVRGRRRAARGRVRVHVVAEALLAAGVLAAGLGAQRLGGAAAAPALRAAEAAVARWLPPADGLPALAPAASMEVTADLVAAPAGRAVLLLAGGQAALLDGGPPAVGEAVVAELRRLGIQRLDLAVMTKASSGEALGLLPVLDALPVGRLYDLAPGSTCPAHAAVLADAAAHHTPVQGAAAGIALPFGPARLEVVWPPADAGSPPSPPSGGGAVRLVDGNVRLLFAGNVDPADFGALLRLSAGLAAQVLELPAGNPGAAADPALLRAVSPRVAVLLPGGGTPDAAVRERLAAARVLAIEASLTSDLSLQTDGRGIVLAFDPGLPGQSAPDSTSLPSGPGAAPDPCA